MTRALRRTWNRLLGSLFRRRADRDLADELESHIQLLTDEHVRRGLKPDEARRRARLTFGSVDAATESHRDRRRLPVIEIIGQDLRYAVRGIRKSPGFALVAILSVGIGIGANTAIFSLVNSVLIQPLAYHDADRVFWAREVTTTPTGRAMNPVNPAHATAWARECASLEQVALVRSSRAQIAAGNEPANFTGVRVQHTLFALFGVEPILGRVFLADEEQEGRDRVIMLSEPVWRVHFNADPLIVGRMIPVDGEPHQVVGVVPVTFRIPMFSGTNIRYDTLRPLVISPEERARTGGNFNYGAIVRIKRDVTIERALAEIDAVEARYRQDVGFSSGLAAALTPLHEHVTGQVRLGLWVLAAAVGAVLLIVCVNLANLLLSRIAGRSREAAIRTALGASRARQFSQVLTESLLLSACGGALGIVVAMWTMRLIVGVTGLDLPRLDEVRVDTTMLAFAVVLTLFAGLLFGALPAWRFTRHDPQAALRAGSHTVTETRGGMHLRKVLIGIQVAISTTMLIVAALLASSLTRLLNVDKGFDAEHVYTLDLNLAGSRYSDPVKRGMFFDRFLSNLAAIPGVQAAALTTQLPVVGQTWNDSIYLEGAPQGRRWPVDNRYTSPGYFTAMNIAILQGRAFDERDRGRGVAVLSPKAAALLWPGDPNPVGKVFMGEDDKPATLVGIVAEVRAVLQQDAPPHAYYPYWQRVPGDGEIVIRAALDPVALAGGLRAVFQAEDPQLPIPPLVPMIDVVDGTIAQRKFQMMLMSVFAASALIVASLGIYGVVSYSVARRRNEMGIRMALGARHAGLLALVVRQGMTPVVAGLGAGVAAALLLSGAVRGLLFEVQPTDPVTIAGVCALLLFVGAMACVIPARRVSGADAIAALRAD